MEGGSPCPPDSTLHCSLPLSSACLSFVTVILFVHPHIFVIPPCPQKYTEWDRETHSFHGSFLIFGSDLIVLSLSSGVTM